MKKVICFGEVLWDVLPSAKKPGGAPMNVTYHLRNLGIESYLISRVGADSEGDALKQFLSEKGIPSKYIQTDERYGTGMALASLDEHQEISYQIVSPVAWDFIEYEESLGALVAASDAMVFGSLAARSPKSRESLLTLLKKARCRLFDLNLRPPYDAREVVEELLSYADVVKMNEGELAVVGKWVGEAEETACIAAIQKRYQVSEVCITKGAKGVSYYTSTAHYEVAAYPVTVQDTVGSGDAFFAGFIASWLSGSTTEEALDKGAALGAFVASQIGATPAYRKEDVGQ